MDNIRQLHGQSTNQSSHFVRMGYTGYAGLESLAAPGRVNIRHAVFDAHHLHRQKDLLHALSDGGTEIILDTKCAESAYEIGLNSRASRS